jgi:amino acid transporter
VAPCRSRELADYTIQGTLTGSISTAALIFLLLRAFASGSAALTGVEAISNGVPAFRKPKGKNAATTLLLLGTVAITMALSILILGNLMNVRLADVDNGVKLVAPDGTVLPPDFNQDPGDRPAGTGDLRPLPARLLRRRCRNRHHP